MAQTENYRRPAGIEDDNYKINGLALTNEFGEGKKSKLDVIAKVAVDCPLSTTLDEGVMIKVENSKREVSENSQKKQKSADRNI